MIKVTIVEDDEDIRRALSLLVDGTRGYRCVGSFADSESAVRSVKTGRPDVILLDIELPGMSGIKAIRKFKEADNAINILMLTVHQDDETVFQALCAGASGYLIKTTSPEKLLSAIKEVSDGGAPMSSNIARMVVQSFRANVKSGLTERENEILSLLCTGQSYKMIAENLFISRDTVHSHIKNIYKKLEVNSKSEAVAKAIREKIV